MQSSIAYQRLIADRYSRKVSVKLLRQEPVVSLASSVKLLRPSGLPPHLQAGVWSLR
jgi:hypothetical protein